MNDIIECSGVVIIQNKQILLVKHGPKAEHLDNTFGIPAGRLENNESVLQCAIRELKEETNLDAVAKDLVLLPKHYVATIERKTEGTRTFSMSVFKCHQFSGELKANEKTIPIWVDITKLHTLHLLPSIQEIVNDSL